MDSTWLIVIGEGLIVSLVLFALRTLSTLQVNSVAQKIWQEQHDKRDEDRFDFHNERIRDLQIILHAQRIPVVVPTVVIKDPALSGLQTL